MLRLFVRWLPKVSPNGMMFVKPTLRKSLLAKMLGELLDTRVMVKTAMKGYKYDKVGALLTAASVSDEAKLTSSRRPRRV